MRSRLLCLAAAFALLALPACRRGQVRVRSDPDSDQQVWRDLVSQKQFGTEARALFYNVEPAVGYAEARHDPTQTLADGLRLHWNATVRAIGVAAQSDRLARQHNSGELTLEEFEQQRDKLQATVSELAALRKRLDEVLAGLTAPEAPTSDLEGRAARQAASVQARAVIQQAERCVAPRPPHKPDASPPG